METHELIHATLEWAKAMGYAQRAREGAGGLAIDELARAQARMQELEEVKSERDALKWQLDEARKDLDAAKVARIEAEREANDLRAWRNGLVKPGTEERKCWPVVAELENGIELVIGDHDHVADGICDRWFDPRDIFKAADRDAKQADMDVRR